MVAAAVVVVLVVVVVVAVVVVVVVAVVAVVEIVVAWGGGRLVVVVVAVAVYSQTFRKTLPQASFESLTSDRIAQSTIKQSSQHTYHFWQSFAETALQTLPEEDKERRPQARGPGGWMIFLGHLNLAFGLSAYFSAWQRL